MEGQGRLTLLGTWGKRALEAATGLGSDLPLGGPFAPRASASLASGTVAPGVGVGVTAPL